jgi:membrane protein required for colicin V production
MAVLFANLVGNMIIEYLDWNPHAVKILAFVIVFIIVMIIVNLMARILEKFFKLVGLNFFNRLAGLGAGVIKMAFILSVVLIFFNYLNRENLLMSDETRESSFLYPKVEAIVPWLLPNDSFINVGIAIDRIKSITDEE